MSPRTALLTLLLTASCRTVAPPLPESTLEALRAHPDAFLSGQVTALADGPVLEQRDFAYTAAFSPDGDAVAFTHLAADGFHLGLYSVSRPEAARWDVRLNPVESDVEALAFTPDGARIATAGRDGAVRLVDAATGALQATQTLDEGLVSLAIHPSGRWLAAGGARGGLMALRLPDLRPLGETQAHRDEVRALAFRPDGTLVSGSWDTTVALWRAVETEGVAEQVRVRPGRSGARVVLRPTLDERAPVSMVLDSRESHVAVTGEAAAAAGIDVEQLTETLRVPTALGTTVARVARGRTLRFKELTLQLDVVVCDACVPAGAQGVLGTPFFAQVDITLDGPAGDAVLTLKPDATRGPRAPRVELTRAGRHTFPNPVNDLALDAAGMRMAVAFSEEPARRTREIYQREKRGVVEPLRPGNAAAVLDVDTGRELFRDGGHHGVVSTAALTPDGATLLSGGWDRTLRVMPFGAKEPVATRRFGWSVRRVRVSHDGRRSVVAAWTPQNPLGDQKSDPAVSVFELVYASPEVRERSAP